METVDVDQLVSDNRGHPVHKGEPDWDRAYEGFSIEERLWIALGQTPGTRLKFDPWDLSSRWVHSWVPAPTGVLRRLAAGLTSMAGRKDGNTQLATTKGTGGDFTVTWWSLAGSFSMRAWWAQARIEVSVGEFQETSWNAVSGTIVVRSGGGDATQFVGDAIGKLITPLVGPPLLRRLMRALSTHDKEPDPDPITLEEWENQVAWIRREESITDL